MRYCTESNKYPYLMRKYPKQSRSEHLVDCILAGAVRILSRLGFNHLDTKTTARESGTSVGSLYQYFPNKESIFARVMELEAEKAKLKVLDILRTRQPKTLSHLCPIIVDAMVDLIWPRPRLFREILRYSQILGRQSYVHKIRFEVIEVLHDYCVKNGIKIDSADPKLSLFVLANSVQGTIEACVCYDGLEMSEQELKSELTRLALRFISAPRDLEREPFGETSPSPADFVAQLGG